MFRTLLSEVPAASAVAAPAMADHNSRWGVGLAIDTRGMRDDRNSSNTRSADNGDDMSRPDVQVEGQIEMRVQRMDRADMIRAGGSRNGGRG